jgi:DNA (cytosine-5)-methyltransferase 1
MNELALFAGAGGGLLATKWFLGWRTVCYVENELYRIEVLKARIRDGLLDDAPIWDDARTFDGRPWRGCVDIVTAGFPCQPFSVAGKMEAQNDERNLWPDTIRVINEVKPEWCLLENTPGLLSGRHGYFGQILADLAEGGYDAIWKVLSAAEVGAPHRRDRVWIVAHTNDAIRTFKRKDRRMGWKRESNEDVANPDQQGPPEHLPLGASQDAGDRTSKLPSWWEAEPQLGRVADGLAHRVVRLAAIGDGQVPAVVAAVWRLLVEEKK